MAAATATVTSKGLSVIAALKPAASRVVYPQYMPAASRGSAGATSRAGSTSPSPTGLGSGSGASPIASVTRTPGCSASGTCACCRAGQAPA